MNRRSRLRPFRPLLLLLPLLAALMLLGCAAQETTEEEAASTSPIATVSPTPSPTPTPEPTPTPTPTPSPTPTPIPVTDCERQKGYISGNGINFRSEPSTDSAILRELSRGVTLTITGEAEGWYRVEIDGETGFISAEFVGKGDVPLSYTVKKLTRHNGCINATKVNMRDEPSTKGNVIQKLSIFTHLTITGETDDWYRVEYEGTTGYVTKKYVEASVGYYDKDDLYLVAQLVWREARSSLSGQIAVANVVYNRLRSRKFPNSIEGVIFQTGQFSPADNASSLRSTRPNRNSIEAVLEIFVRGKTILPRSVLYFRSARLGKEWASSRTYYAEYGGNYFFK